MPKPEDQPENHAEETPAQRSARLEAEAAAGIFSGGPKPKAPEAAPAPAAPSKEAEEKIAALQAELDKTKDQMLRALAEAENSRKRALKERDDATKYSIAGFAKDLLSVADNLRRALDAIPAEAMAADPHLKTLNDGVEATEREMLKGFEKAGIRKIIPEGEPFNPNFHEVMYEAPGTGKPPGTITQVIEAGYILHDRLLRPARVGVAKDDGGAHMPPGGHIDIKS